MLKNKEDFDRVEKELTEEGTIKEFTDLNGKIEGRMMISVGEPPEDLELDLPPDVEPLIYIGSFDFMNAEIGIAMNKETFMPESGVWITPQEDDAVIPSDEWLDLFIEILVENQKRNGEIPKTIFVFFSQNDDLIYSE